MEPVVEDTRSKLAIKYGFTSTPAYINHLIETGKIGSPSYQKWVEAGRKGMFSYEEWR